ncbi:MAG TPA: extracellular solute-binding protein [Acidimicrobiales bacterium]|nr:extracellular solute-binding protein [Acidimicrobiales bacterium]
MSKRWVPSLLVAVLAAVGLAACSPGGDDDEALVIYSGRSENLVRPILERFEEETDVDIEVRYGDTAELAAAILEEGDNTRADVFFSQDAGALAALADRDLLAGLREADLEIVPPRFRDPDGRWLGVTGRARVVAYSTERVQESDIPEDVFGLTDPRWNGKVGLPPTNASFIAYVSALTEQYGADRTKQLLIDLKANGLKTYDNNIVTIEAIADGEIDLGLVNHYYLYSEFEERPDLPVANFYPGQQDGGDGTFVNLAGVGILEGTSERADADRLVAYLLGPTAQEYFSEETTEYPLRDGVAASSDLPPLDSIRTIELPLSELGKDLEASLDLINEVGLT